MEDGNVTRRTIFGLVVVLVVLVSSSGQVSAGWFTSPPEKEQPQIASSWWSGFAESLPTVKATTQPVPCNKVQEAEYAYRTALALEFIGNKWGASVYYRMLHTFHKGSPYWAIATERMRELEEEIAEDLWVSGDFIGCGEGPQNRKASEEDCHLRVVLARRQWLSEVSLSFHQLQDAEYAYLTACLLDLLNEKHGACCYYREVHERYKGSSFWGPGTARLFELERELPKESKPIGPSVLPLASGTDDYCPEVRNVQYELERSFPILHLPVICGREGSGRISGVSVYAICFPTRRRNYTEEAFAAKCAYLAARYLDLTGAKAAASVLYRNITETGEDNPYKLVASERLRELEPEIAKEFKGYDFIGGEEPYNFEASDRKRQAKESDMQRMQEEFRCLLPVQRNLERIVGQGSLFPPLDDFLRSPSGDFIGPYR
jgi:hypothetical protein